MHHDVYRQIRTGVAMQDAYHDWSAAKRSKKNPAAVQSLYRKYVDLKNQMNDYEPDPAAKF